MIFSALGGNYFTFVVIFVICIDNLGLHWFYIPLSHLSHCKTKPSSSENAGFVSPTDWLIIISGLWPQPLKTRTQMRFAAHANPQFTCVYIINMTLYLNRCTTQPIYYINNTFFVYMYFKCTSKCSFFFTFIFKPMFVVVVLFVVFLSS